MEEKEVYMEEEEEEEEEGGDNDDIMKGDTHIQGGHIGEGKTKYETRVVMNTIL